jgi:hypothetical protein
VTVVALLPRGVIQHRLIEIGHDITGGWTETRSQRARDDTAAGRGLKDALGIAEDASRSPGIPALRDLLDRENE